MTAGVQLIQDPSGLARALEQASNWPRVALDTEGNGMHAYRTQLCLIQLAPALPDAPSDDVVLIDALALPDLHALDALMMEPSREVVIHDLAFDVRLLRAAGVGVRRVIDTSVHARFLGIRETGLRSLLLARHAIAVSEEMQHDDWGHRPLSDGQLAYLASDVAYLGMLAAGLQQQAEAAGIVEEIHAETDYALANALELPPDGPAYAQVRGALEMTPVGRAVLREVFAIRERMAEQRNMPSGRVLSVANMTKIARHPPVTLADLRKVVGPHEAARAVLGELYAGVERARLAGDVPESERALFARAPFPPGEAALRRAREAALTTWRQAESTARGVDPQVVLPGHALSAIAQRAPATLEDLGRVPGIGAVRVTRYGDTIVRLVAEAVHRQPLPG